MPHDISTPVTRNVDLGHGNFLLEFDAPEAIREMEPGDMTRCVDLIHEVLTSLEQISDKEYRLDPAVQARVRNEVKRIAAERPIRTYTQPNDWD